MAAEGRVLNQPLTALPFWEHLTKKEKDTVLERQAVVKYRAGTHVRGGDSDCLGLIIMLKGVFRAYLLSPDGREMTLYRIKSGEVCVMSASCALDAVSFETHVVAEEDSEVLLIPVYVYASLVAENIHVECFSYKMAAERFSDVVAGVERLVFFTIEQRIASFLLDEAAEAEGQVVHKTHEQIAVAIGSAREVVSRALKSMEKRSLVEVLRGGVRLRDKAALYALVSPEV